MTQSFLVRELVERCHPSSDQEAHLWEQRVRRWTDEGVYGDVERQGAMHYRFYGRHELLLTAVLQRFAQWGCHDYVMGIGRLLREDPAFHLWWKLAATLDISPDVILMLG
jgi:hypothetical protein